MISVNQQIQNNNLRPGEKIRDEEMMNIRKKPVCDTKTSYVCLTSSMFFCAFISIPLAMKKHSAAAFAWSSSPVSMVPMWKWGPFWSKGAVDLHKSSTPFRKEKNVGKAHVAASKGAVDLHKSSTPFPKEKNVGKAHVAAMVVSQNYFEFYSRVTWIFVRVLFVFFQSVLPS